MKNEMAGKGKMIVSTCLVGVHTQWDGGCSKVDDIVALIKSGRAVFLCPEQLGGLSTPREPAEIEEGKTAADVLAGRAKVVARTGQDVTVQFMGGAQEVLAFCQAFGIKTAILKARSPSCGSRRTYDGTFSETTRPGRGVTAELLEQNGIKVYSEETYSGKV